MSSTRTQVYLRKEQRARLDALARREDKTLAELIRNAVDAYLHEVAPDIDGALSSTFGSMPSLEVLSRDEWDRG